jgi:RNA polymerase sigma-70 factor, ECF subfamily
MRGSEDEAREAFEAEMLPYLDAAFRLSRVLTGRQQDAEDLVQDAYLRAFAGFRTYKRGTNARAWLLTIVRRTFLNNQRKVSSRPVTSSLNAGDREIDPQDTRALGTEEQVLLNIDSRALLGALTSLPEPFRSVLALVDLEGMRYAEAARILGCPVGTVMSRLHRARAILARRLQALNLEYEAR